FGEIESSARNPLLESLSLEILHHQKVAACVGAEVVKRADVRMRQRRDRARFPLESLMHFLVFGDAGGKNFQRNRAVDARVLCSVHISHSTLGEVVDDFIWTE